MRSKIMKHYVAEAHAEIAKMIRGGSRKTAQRFAAAYRSMQKKPEVSDITTGVSGQRIKNETPRQFAREAANAGARAATMSRIGDAINYLNERIERPNARRSWYLRAKLPSATKPRTGVKGKARLGPAGRRAPTKNMPIDNPGY